MVRHLKDRGTYVLFNTNGTVLNLRNGRALIEAGLDELRVSFDASNAKSYRAIRGKDYFNRILKNVRAFRDLQEREGHDKPRVSAWLTGLRETVEQLPDFVRVAAETGREGDLSAAPRFLRGGCDRPRNAGPGSVRATHERRIRRYLEHAASLARSLGRDVQRFRRGIRAGHESQAQRHRLALVDVPPAVDGDVFHCERSCASMLHRAVLAARL